MGIDYGNGLTNVSDTQVMWDKRRVRFGVISQHRVGEAWYEDAEPNYGSPHCPDCGNQLDDDVDDGHECECGYTIDWVGDECYGDGAQSYDYDQGGYEATLGGDDYDIWITKSPFYTLCDFCSPCAPGAGYLTGDGDDCAAFCFGPDWFEGDPPYDVYNVKTGELVCEGVR